jgi:murE/murF fusion protein
MTRPKVGIITNVAEAHIENFKNITGIAKAKSEIINNIEPGGTIILNRDDKFFNYMKNKAIKKKINLLSFGFSKNSDIRLIKIKKLKKNFSLKIKAVDEYLNIKTKDINNPNIYNILCCIAVLKIFNLEIDMIKNFFTFTYFLVGRGKIHKVKRFKTYFKLIDESYNANPLSVKNALLNLSKIKNKNSKKYVLLGDMLELGNRSEFYHKNLSKIINNTDIDKVFVYGNKVLKTYKYISQKKQGNILQNKNDFDEVFSELIKKNDYLMIKGSNATGLNKLSENIIKGVKNVI